MAALRRSTLILFLLVLALPGMAQKWAVVRADSALPKAFVAVERVEGPIALEAWKQGVRSDLIARGWLEASCDSCVTSGDTAVCTFHLGQSYRWARLSRGNVPLEIASASHFRERAYRERPVSPRQLARLMEDLLDQCENNGYPFAETGLDSVRIDGDGMHAALWLYQGPEMRYDSVVVKGEARINPRYLRAHIGIKPGDPYNESLALALEKRIKELPFINQRQPPYIRFTPQHARLYLFLDPKKASSFNGILGVLPDPATGKVNFTGDIDLRLRNALKHGEAIDLNWRALKDKSQDLKVKLNYPFAFDTPFGIDLSLKLFKRDTTFLEVTTRAALEYLLPRGDKVGVFINDKSSQRLGRNFSATPGLGDVKLTSYGLALLRERFDYRFNPRSGMRVEVDGSVGRKRSTTATLVESASTEPERSTQYETNAQAIFHIPLGRRATLRLAGQGGSMVNEKLYRNEVYRIGGIKSLRGADEASIYCSSFGIGTVEYRFLFEENSNVFVFFDQAWIEDRTLDVILSDTPMGFGAGTSFETKAGIFSLTYALGRQFNNPIELRGGKVHFGFTSLF